MLGPRHAYTPDPGEWGPAPVGAAWPCAQCGLPRANEVHDLPAAPALDGRQAAAGEGVQEVQALGFRVASWSNPAEASLTIAYDADQLAADGPVVTVLATEEATLDDLVQSVEIVIPLARLEEMVASIRRRVDGS